jgi:Calx-beta domain
MKGLRRALAVVSGAAMVFAILLPITAARADGLVTNFEGYTLGTVDGQDGWSSVGAAGGGCGSAYDHEVADVSAMNIPGFGDKALRISNAVTSGCFDQTYSKPNVDEAGETDADNSGQSGGTRQSHFDGTFYLASMVPGAEQSGLTMEVSPDRGDGSRMSFVRFEDQSDGVHVIFADYQDVAPFGAAGSESDGCDTGDDFVSTDIATLDRSVPHLVQFSMDFVDGARNDVVKIYIDGSLVHTGTSWEDYYRWCTESQPPVDVSRTVDSLLFHTRGANAPATDGNGFLIDQVQTQTSTPSSSTLVVNENNAHGWTFFQHLAPADSGCGAGTVDTGSQSFVNGPASPPAGTGSRKFTVGSDGDSFEGYGQVGVSGTKLADVTALAYSTYVSQYGSGGQAPYFVIRLDYNNDTVTDDRFFFEPVYQDGTYSGDPFPAQPALTLNTWQTWDALHGGWWSENDGFGGPPLRTLQQVVADHPDATLVNDGGAAMRLSAGCGGAAWANFVGNADKVTLGVNGSDTTWNFEHVVPPTPSLSINDPSVTEGNSGTRNLTFKITPSGSSPTGMSVHFAITGGTATSGADYVPLAAGNRSWAANDASPKTIVVKVKGDKVDESNETVIMKLSNPVNATIADGTGVGTIVDDDSPPSLTVHDTGIDEGNSGNTPVAFKITLSSASTHTITVHYTTADGSAVAPGDYQTKTGVVTFSPGQKTKTVTVNVKGDMVVEPNEAFYLNLFSPTNATLNDPVGACVIRNDD